MKKTFYLLALLSLCACSPKEQSRQSVDFTENWQFQLADGATDYSAAAADASGWRTLNLPHDWSIESDFSEAYPATPGGGALPGGIGWYRKTFDANTAWQGKQVYIDFDGVYWNSEVWLNGVSLGVRPNGYISFRYDLTPHLRFGTKNVIAVKVDNSQQPNSRWYSGSGIYRNVRLDITNSVHIDLWGTQVTTPQVSEQEAVVRVQTTIKNDAHADVQIRQTLLDAQGKKVASVQSNDTTQDLLVHNPHLWSIETPYLYSLKTVLLVDGNVTDEYTTKVGIRTFEFTADKGFFLNGKQVKINGVCNHHDLGCLGAAVNYRAIQRQLEILKAMGCNGIRCSHNPPAPELLDLCDAMGFIVMDEAFDVWRRSKSDHDYSLYFEAWHERDLTDLIVRDRNHPSVFLWSIGNEVWEQGGGVENQALTRHLAEIIRTLDPTRPITAGCNDVNPFNNVFQSGALDIVGFNYHRSDYDKVKDNFPGKPFIASESISGLMSRGFYMMPADTTHIWPSRWDIAFDRPIHQCPAYDNCHVPWGDSHEESWNYIKKADFVAGQYIWTGFDYLGEPTPFGWPSRSSYFGIIDLAGFPKDIYYMYQSEWTNQSVLHLLPHWNWQVGETIDVWAYYSNADEVELFLNNQSLGTKRKEGDDLHVAWRVEYAPGALKAVSRKAGKEVLVNEIKTAGAPASLRLTADKSALQATGKDLSFITVEALDKDGNTVPTADNLISFTVEGPGTIVGTDNGDATDGNSLKKPERNLFNGKALVVVQGTKQKGTVTLKATSDGLTEDKVELKIKNK
ncbi:beta-galactosidase [Bacteroidia bacterium]|nr:beta-galactosidase [Bacteroidia bacterium]